MGKKSKEVAVEGSKEVAEASLAGAQTFSKDAVVPKFMVYNAEENNFVSKIADPLLTGKAHSKVLKMLKKAHDAKAVKRGVPEVTKLVRKGQKGMVVLAADIFPVELISHLPLLCEEKDVMYCYVKSRAELGLAIKSKRPVSALFVQKPTSDSVYEEEYTAARGKVEEIHPYMGKNLS